MAMWDLSSSDKTRRMPPSQILTSRYRETSLRIAIARLLIHFPIEMERFRQPLARFGIVRFQLKHDVLHAEFRVAPHCRRELMWGTCQGIVEEPRFLWLEIWEPESDESRDSQRRWVTAYIAASGVDFGDWLGHCFWFAHVARVPNVGILCSQLEHARTFHLASHHQRGTL